MRWFGKTRQVEIWEEKIDAPLGDIEAAQRIRHICRTATDSAERVGQVAAGAGETRRKPDLKKNKEASERYERAARAAMETAMKVSDDLMRDSSVRQIVELCLTAKDVKTARILFRAIQAPSIRSEVLREHPVLQAE
jgi:hypothetical protein